VGDVFSSQVPVAAYESTVRARLTFEPVVCGGIVVALASDVRASERVMSAPSELARTAGNPEYRAEDVGHRLCLLAARVLGGEGDELRLVHAEPGRVVAVERLQEIHSRATLLRMCPPRLGAVADSRGRESAWPIHRARSQPSRASVLVGSASPGGLPTGWAVRPESAGWSWSLEQADCAGDD
jgi:hypothetical protein